MHPSTGTPDERSRSERGEHRSRPHGRGRSDHEPGPGPVRGVMRMRQQVGERTTQAGEKRKPVVKRNGAER